MLLNSLLLVLKSRLFATAMLSVSLAAIIGFTSANTKAVVINDEGRSHVKFTFKDDPQAILADSNIQLMGFDAVSFSGFEGKIGEINISRAFEVTITADGKSQTLMTTESTVEKLLTENGIELSRHDIVNLPLEMLLRESREISITRVDYVDRESGEPIPFETMYKKSSLIKDGLAKVIIEGEDGVHHRNYIQQIIDGIPQTESLSGEIMQSPVNELILVGDSSVPVSSLDFGLEFDENGRPVGYVSVIEDAIATGYSAGRGAWGASGMDLFYGYVAVDPAVIPYGTKMYIAARDGSFVYGCAIAADTGIALLDGIIDVDLYYETYIESCLNGRRIVDIYIME